MLRYVAALIIIAGVILSTCEAFDQQAKANPSRSDGPLTGSTNIEGLGTIQWSYHFDHNALRDAKRIGPDIVALTESGNLVRFDAETLSVTGQQIVPGRGVSIAQGESKKLLIGAEDGQIYDLLPTTLALAPVTKASGRVVWLTVGAVAGRPHSIVAVVDARANVMPWPGESFKKYETRSAQIERRVINPLRILIFAGGTSKYIPFKRSSFSTPGSFMLDDSNRLWMGADKGEWGGEYSYMELPSGYVRTFKTDAGVLGFLKVRGGRVLGYGGMSHMGIESGFIADVSHEPAVSIREFTNSPKTELPEATKRVLDQAKEKRPEPAAGSPQGPIDLIIEDKDSAGFWVLSEHDVYRCNRDFAKWEKVAGLGGRWSGGRIYSVGDTPTVRRLLVAGGASPDLVAVSARDGLARISNGNVQHVRVQGQIESSIIEVWPTSLGVVFLNDDELHTGWHLDKDGWERLRFLPDTSPSDAYAAWMFAQPILDDHGIVAYFGSNITPGERGFLKVGDQLKATVSGIWRDDSSSYGSSILGTSDGEALEVSKTGLRRWNGKQWETAGRYVGSGSDTDRHQLLIGRSYVRLMKGKASEVFLDAGLGDLLRLTKSEKGFDLRRLTTPEGPAPGGVFDATADGEGFLLLATASGLIRFNPETGERRVIPAPNATEEFKTAVRDDAGRIWAAGNLLYVSVDEGKHWSAVRLQMLGPTYMKRIREVSSGTMAIALHDLGVVFLNQLLQ